MTRLVSPGQQGAFAAKQPLRQFGPTSRSVIHRDSVNEPDRSCTRMFSQGTHANRANGPTRVQ
jgi:hypothetical protein